MAEIDVTYQALCREIFDKGYLYENKNRGVERTQITGFTFKHSFKDGFPALTNKYLPFKWVATELLWFLRGDTNIQFLNFHGVNIWNKDAYKFYQKLPESFKGPVLSEDEFNDRGVGSVGKNYSYQWRSFNGHFDQITNLIDQMKDDIMSSRLKVAAWNPCETEETALPPCHTDFQIVGVPLGDGTFGFELHWAQRSVDVFLGLPFNIASYALLAKMLEKLTGFKALGIQGNLTCVHFYENQYGAAKELLARDPLAHPNCELAIQISEEQWADLRAIPFASAIGAFMPDEFKLKGYTSDKPIKVDMLSPNL